MSAGEAIVFRDHFSAVAADYANARPEYPAALFDWIATQALHWFDRDAYFAECGRVLRPGGLLVAWGYQEIEVPPVLADADARLQDAIRPYWPPERTLVDDAYAGFDWPFDGVAVPGFEMQADWSLARLLGYFGSYSATRRCREATGADPVAALAGDFAAAWGDPARTQRVSWPLFIHARRKR